MDRDLVWQASIDYEKSFKGKDTRINVSGEDLITVAHSERIGLGLGGKWERDGSFIEGKVRVSASNSENIHVASELTFVVTF